MLLGSAIFGSTPLGALSDATDEPVDANGESAVRWRLRLLVDGVDWTARLVGEPSVDREEGAAALCAFDLCLPAGPVTPTDWKGREVLMDYIGTMAGITTEQRLFTGRVVDPTWSSTGRTLSCTCSDQLQQRVEVLEVAAIDALTGGYWSEDVFEPVTGRSRWDYAMERMSTRAASLDCDTYGTLRTASWYPAEAPHFVFGAGCTVYDTLDVQLSDLSTETNQVEVESEYRFPRLWQLNQSFGWVHPDTDGHTGETAFCSWYPFTSELPTAAMFEDAVSGSGQQVISSSFATLPPSGIYCLPPVGWINNQEAERLFLYGGVTGARRWVQSVTESYKFTVVADVAVDAVGPVVERDGTSFELESEEADAWESEVISGGGSGHQDIHDLARRDSLLLVNLNKAVTSIIGGHRGTQLSWAVPTSWVADLDLIHTIKLDEPFAKAIGKVCRLQYRLNLATGEALTTVTIAVMRGGGSITDPFVLPAPSETDEEPGAGGGELQLNLPTQLGSSGSPNEYDDDLDGFSGNYSVLPGDFPRRMQVTSIEIPESQRDELKVEFPIVYRVAIPNNQLELY